MKKIFVLIILFISITAGAGTAFADTGQTNIITKYPKIGTASTIPATFQTLMNSNIVPLEKTIIPFAFLIFLFAMAIRLYLNEEGGYMKEIFYMIFIISLLVMYNVVWNWLEAVIHGIATAIMPANEVSEFFKTLFSETSPKISIWDLNLNLILGALAAAIAGLAAWIIEWLRFLLLAFMYLIGPIVISLSIIPPLRPLLKAWIRDTIEIMSWLITLAILYQILNTLISTYIDFPSLTNTDPIVMAAILVLFIVLVILAPMLTGKLYKGGMGALGSIASAATTMVITGGTAAALGAAGITGGGLMGGIGAKMARRGTLQATRDIASKKKGAARHAAENANQHKFHPYRKKKNSSDEEE
ncbi:MAG: hypothetical protein EVJ46_00060 [Candidatus Acididesulfobacter guangdongensis]|uniref:Type IV secretion system protein n=1 Tax=Acididesulfobacter guangdongensis TaxID=2597225 RepID=A0A519BHD5_ACIG2|nr:MAG: hypothetical protein EVJ46_00060 [Candidatus Acididesulfobacter guangdongensis]